MYGAPSFDGDGKLLLRNGSCVRVEDALLELRYWLEDDMNEVLDGMPVERDHVRAGNDGEADDAGGVRAGEGCKEGAISEQTKEGLAEESDMLSSECKVRSKAWGLTEEQLHGPGGVDEVATGERWVMPIEQKGLFKRMGELLQAGNSKRARHGVETAVLG